MTSKTDKHDRSVIPYLLSVCSAYALVLSVLYNFAYFCKLDLKLFSLMSFQDHILSSLSWLLLSIPFFIVVVVSEILRMNSLARKKKPDGHPLSFMLGGLLPLSVYSFGKDVSLELAVGFATFIIWAAFIPLVFNRLAKFHLSQIDKYLVVMSPIVLVLSLMAGFSMAKKDMKSQSYVDLDMNNSSRKVFLIRNLDKGIIAKEGDNFVFITWDKISQIIIKGKQPEKAEIKNPTPDVPLR